MQFERFLEERAAIVNIKKWGYAVLEYNGSGGRVEYPLKSAACSSICDAIEEIIEIELLEHCPFCGSNDIKLPFRRKYGYHGFCSCCKAYGGFSLDKNAAIDLWNKRDHRYIDDLLSGAVDEVTERIIRERNRVLEAIPECELHGSQCVPHALDWVERMKRLEKAHEGIDARWCVK